MTFEIEAIGKIRCTRLEAVDDHWDQEQSALLLDPEVLGDTAAQGIEAFSHVEVIYVFDRVAEGKIVYDARRPRGNESWPKVGILAQRGKNRPNRLGATICEVVSVDGLKITVTGLDAIDGTPIVDVKPVMKGFLPRSTVLEPSWSNEIMANYW